MGVASVAGGGSPDEDDTGTKSSSRGAPSSSSGQGVRMAELGTVCHDQVVDGVMEIKLADGLKC
jgi:hypothetical protein